MPYKSEAQRRFFNSPGAKKAGITAKEVAEYNAASKGMKLPEKKSKHPGLDQAGKRFAQKQMTEAKKKGK